MPLRAGGNPDRTPRPRLLPMLYAQAHGRRIDTFVIYTDSETWAGDVHPPEALRDYRRASAIEARLVVVGMASNGFSIADLNDPGMLDVVGFDTAVRMRGGRPASERRSLGEPQPETTVRAGLRRAIAA
jgi:hypothetical protein